jgi:hypothetical protein
MDSDPPNLGGLARLQKSKLEKDDRAMPIATAAPAIIGAGASLLGANSAARASRNATRSAMDLQRQQYDQTRADQQPYVQAGYDALGGYQDAINAPSTWAYGPQDYLESPGFNYLLDRSLDQVQARAAAGGYSLSSAAMRQLADTTQGLLSQDYYQQQGISRANYESDRNYRTGGLYNLTTLGQNAAAGVGTAGQTYANYAGNALIGDARYRGDAMKSAYGTAGDLIGKGLDAYAAGRQPSAPTPPIIPRAYQQPQIYPGNRPIDPYRT